jgi:predicted Zn-dependent protease with MMP-like domain
LDELSEPPWQPSEPFDALITQALENLPEEFRAQLGSVAIVVDDYPTPGQLAATHAHGLFGIYEGVPRTAYGADNAAIASKITLFRGPLVAYSRTPADLAAAVEETLFHEIGHHLGISDARLQELAAERRLRTSR